MNRDYNELIAVILISVGSIFVCAIASGRLFPGIKAGFLKGWRPIQKRIDSLFQFIAPIVRTVFNVIAFIFGLIVVILGGIYLYSILPAGSFTPFNSIIFLLFCILAELHQINKTLSNK